MTTPAKQKKVLRQIEKFEKKVPKFKKQVKTFSIFLGVVLALGILGLAFYSISKFYDKYRVRFQVPRIDFTVYWPVIVEDRKYNKPKESYISPIQEEKKVQSMTKTKKEIVASSKYAKFIDHVWERESGRGTNPSGLAGQCAAKGESNEFGFFPQGSWCFDTFEESVARMERWYEEHSDLTYNQKLCLYNMGQIVQVCPYLSYNFAGMN